MNIRLTNEQYNTLKWLISIVIPALITFVGVVMNTLNYAHTEVFLQVAVAFEALLGAIFKVSEHTYDKEKENK